MAYLDVKAYYLEVEEQYKNMLELIKQLEDAQAKGEIDKERVKLFKDNAMIMKSNYERLAYIMHLFNRPKSTKKHNKVKDDLEDKFEFIGASKKQVIDENTFILNDFKQYLDNIAKEK